MAQPDYPALARKGMAALREDRPDEALDLFRQVTEAGRGDASVWVAQAYACRALGDSQGAVAAVDQALRLESRNCRALLLKGDHFADLRDRRSAITFYAAAIQQAPKAPAPDLAAALDRAQAFVSDTTGGFEPFLKARFEAEGLAPSDRFAWSLDLMAGRTQLYLQQPRFYYFPGLPQIQFAPRDATPWLDGVEAAADDIRDELLAVMDDPQAFAPYVEMRENRPNSAQAGMLENPEWSAYYLVRDGAPAPENAARFPRTLAALQGLPLTDIPGRAPSVLFSRLEPGAHIPPHNGLVNTRLICHLPLIVPPGCSLRVGSETHEWRYGQAFAFDDTVEHEAWNTSDQTRVVLIFDVWKPEITEPERALIRTLFSAIEDYGGGGAGFGV
ncbi:aspartyl/asparaginyl beta-hydroxylase domain-containing protein [Brevundimonas sp.]|uniref:aspartyl/asparaginyl beta-hydroxylase domain-containing protein n=1 Tax=Brevundimonas sp. TaxID=1871086 RepID=UPI0025F35CEE|nr:aspartyl/asparaginyl beta-hydroxylase domain-containing protein [Brevundimonas sp.]